MNALLVYPRYPVTFMSFTYALSFVHKKAALPPMGLLTVAAMLPPEWSKKVVDLNVEPLTSAQLDWADVVFVSAMIVQKESALEVISRCRAKGLRVVAGGPLFTHLYQQIGGVDHFVVGEAEGVLPIFLEDLERGTAKPVYLAEGHPDLALTPTPSWELIDFRHYHSMSIQFSRGCPFDCDFCDIVQLFGRPPRFKKPAHVIAELEVLYRLGWRKDIMMVDDNFICNKTKTKNLLHEIIAWQRQRGMPFNFNTQASVNLAQEPDLLWLMAEANFDSVFLGIETPALESLKECNKRQNQVDLLNAVRTIQSHGLVVSGGFIIGFDSDPPSIFDDQVSFIEQAGIPTAMVGLLSVGPGTRLFSRLKAQGRLLGLPSGDNAMDLNALNFITKMSRKNLIAGYKSVLGRLYEPGAYYRRVISFLDRYKKARQGTKLPCRPLARRELAAAVRIFWRLGFREYGRRAFWAFLLKVGLTRPARFPLAISFAALGYHFRRMTDMFIKDQGALQEA